MGHEPLSLTGNLVLIAGTWAAAGAAGLRYGYTSLRELGKKVEPGCGCLTALLGLATLQMLGFIQHFARWPWLVFALLSSIVVFGVASRIGQIWLLWRSVKAEDADSQQGQPSDPGT